MAQGGIPTGVALGPRHRWRTHLLARAVLTAAPPGPIVDVGAGSGRLARRLRGSGRWVIAVEVSFAEAGRSERGESAAPSALAVGRARLDWLSGVAQRLPLADGSAGAVVFSEVLEHVSDDTAAVAEARRVLGSGGVVVATVPAGPGRLDAFDAQVGHHRRYDSDSLRRLMTEAGLNVERLRSLGGPVGRAYEVWVMRTALRLLGPLADASRLVTRRKLLALGTSGPATAAGSAALSADDAVWRVAVRGAAALKPELGRGLAECGVGWLVVARRC